MYACIKDLQIDSDTDFPNRNNIAFHNGKGKKKKEFPSFCQRQKYKMGTKVFPGTILRKQH